MQVGKGKWPPPDQRCEHLFHMCCVSACLTVLCPAVCIDHRFGRWGINVRAQSSPHAACTPLLTDTGCAASTMHQDSPFCPGAPDSFQVCSEKGPPPICRRRQDALLKGLWLSHLFTQQCTHHSPPLAPHLLLRHFSDVLPQGRGNRRCALWHKWCVASRRVPPHRCCTMQYKSTRSLRNALSL